MTNYNDGKWHGWNGGECPVHPKSVIQAFYMMSGGAFPVEFKAEASKKIWSAPFIFRVVKEHREPREFWIVSSQSFDDPLTALDFQAKIKELDTFKQVDVRVIHVREVIE